MTSEDDVRLRVLSKLLADERDPEKVKVLAVEVGRLLTLDRKPLPTSEKPRSS
jgi:plasmid stability protein